MMFILTHGKKFKTKRRLKMYKKFISVFMSILFIGCLSESTHENESSENESNEDSLIGGSINSLEEFQKQFNERDFGDFSAKNLEPVESSNFRKIEIPNPGEVNTATVIKGSVITDEAQISLGTISGKVGDL